MLKTDTVSSSATGHVVTAGWLPSHYPPHIPFPLSKCLGWLWFFAWWGDLNLYS